MSIIKPGEDPDDLRSSGVVVDATKHSAEKDDEEYNELLAKVNELSKQKIELQNSIKLKKNNNELSMKVRYAMTGRDMAEIADAKGVSVNMYYHILMLFLGIIIAWITSR